MAENKETKTTNAEKLEIYDYLLSKNQFVKATHFLYEIGWLSEDELEEKLASARRMEGKED